MTDPKAFDGRSPVATRYRRGTEADSGSVSIDLLGTVIRFVVTLAILAAAAWWLTEVAANLGTAPTRDAQGNTIVDKYQRAKDILLVVLPLVTTAVGYWFGSQGKEKAETEASKAKDKVTAMAAVSSDPDLLKTARDKYPDAFRE